MKNPVPWLKLTPYRDSSLRSHRPDTLRHLRPGQVCTERDLLSKSYGVSFGRVT
jgi:hypothetical protein